jgi:hypothetical protein
MRRLTAAEALGRPGDMKRGNARDKDLSKKQSVGIAVGSLHPVALLPFVAGIPFVAFTILVLRHFYILGGFWGDSGQISYVLWHSDLLLDTSRMSGAASYFATHITPIFIPISLLSRIVPLTKVQFFAAFTGVCHMLPSIAVYWLLVSSYRMRSTFGLLGAAAVSVLFAFNGLALAAARNPHFEMLVVGSGMMFLVALVQRRFGLATLFYVTCLATREDAGFHLFALLAVATAIGYWRGAPWHAQKPLLLFGLCAFGYSASAIVLQQILFPGSGSFQSVYLGTPAFNGVTWAEIGNRLAFYVVYRSYIFLPAYAVLVWAIRLHSPYVIAGFVACVPWGLLHLLAASPIAGTLSNYYSFPIIFALFWPLVGFLIEGQQVGYAAGVNVKSVMGFALILLTSFIGLNLQHNPGHIDFPASFVFAPSQAQMKATDEALQNFARFQSALGNVVVDAGVAALDPDHYDASETVSSPQKRRPDTVIFFSQGYERTLAMTMASNAGLQRLYQVPNTFLRVATNRPLDGIDGLVPAGTTVR